jgi:predicted cupin superfamily sugar epimerase
MPDAGEIIERLGLAAHPEGGWYVETWRAEAAPGERAVASAILFLLAAGESSHWHRVDAAELWLHHRGAAERGNRRGRWETGP